jgi:hypothetical protein
VGENCSVGSKRPVGHPTLPTGNPIDVTVMSQVIVVPIPPGRFFENTHCTNENSRLDAHEISILGFSKRQYQKLIGEWPYSNRRTDVLAVLPRKSTAIMERLYFQETIVVTPVHFEIVEYLIVQFVYSPAR